MHTRRIEFVIFRYCEGAASDWDKEKIINFDVPQHYVYFVVVCISNDGYNIVEGISRSFNTLKTDANGGRNKKKS